ncbi:MAG: SDR family oxidoreductase [Rhabdochlamydiaceae bacterium]|nr:SDR family oxidoreductase [Rhabdochlamydiaceae bacterium]
MSKVLVTGATGFIGKRLLFQLLDLGHEVYALSRIRGIPIGSFDHPNLHVIYGDLKDPSKIDPIPQDIDAAYYLIHSMAEKVNNLLEHEQKTAQNFVNLLEKTDCKHIIYLGGIIDEKNNLSPHLFSRQQVENVLKSSKIPVTVLRASIIIGAGSASFEIIRDLVEKLPIMVAPKWIKTLCQPLSIVDVLFYLSASLLNKDMFHQTYDIGGPEVMSFKQVLINYAKFRNLKRFLIEVPILTPRLSSYWLVFISSVRFSLCSYLVESMKHNTICHIGNINAVIPHTCLSFEETLKRAFMKISQNEVVSTWMDAWQIEGSDPDLTKYIQLPQGGCLKDEKTFPLRCSREESIARVWKIGGNQGWYGLEWAWQLRGLIDKMLGGAGMNRGRRHPFEIEIGDSIDFWRVVKADKKEGHLILYAEMKLPGEAWLEFLVKEKKLHQTALFRPKGVLGRLYWYSMIPFHFFIFKKMAQKLSEA